MMIPGVQERERGGAGQFILFLMLKVSAARRPQATDTRPGHSGHNNYQPHITRIIAMSGVRSAQEAFTCNFNSFGVVLMAKVVANSDLDRITSLWPSWSFTNLKLLFEFLSAADDIIADMCL